MGNADSSTANRDNCLCFKCTAMPFKHLGYQGNALCCRHVGEAHQAPMRSLLHIDKLSEVGIDRHQDSAFGGGATEQCLITRINSKSMGLDNVMPLVAQPFCQMVTDAPVDKKSHDSATDTADSVSLAMTACA